MVTSTVVVVGASGEFPGGCVLRAIRLREKTDLGADR